MNPVSSTVLSEPDHRLVRTLIDNLPDLLFIKDAQSRIVLDNLAHAQTLSASHPSEVTGKTNFDFFPEALARQFFTDEQTVIQSGQALHREEMLVEARTGTKRWLQTSKIPLKDTAGKVIGLAGISRDITDRKAAEAALIEAREELERRVEARTAELRERNAALRQHIAERERAEAAFAQERDLLRALMDNIPDYIYFKDCASRFLRCSRHQLALFHLESPEQVLGKTDFDFFTAEHARPAFEDEHRIIRTGQPIIGSVEKETWPDGRVTWVSTTKMPLRNEAGEIIGTFGISRDITERKQTEEELRQAEEALARERNILRTLIDSLPDYIFVKDAESRFLLVNQACAVQLGALRSGEVVGKTDADFVNRDLAQAYRLDELALMKSAQPVDKEEPTQHKTTGEMRWSLTTKIPLKNDGGQVIGLVGIGRDITAIKTAEKRLEDLHHQLLTVSRQAGMAEVATDVLHNVGNVLNSVNVSAILVAEKLQRSKAVSIAKVATLLNEHAADLGAFMTQHEKGQKLPGYLTMLSEGIAREQQEVQQELASLRDNIEHIKEIVAMQQSYARVSGMVETVPLRELVEDALKMHSGAYLRHAVRLAREYEDVPSITTDKHKVLQILVNLLHNAKYACDESDRVDKQVTVRVTRGGEDQVKIEVADNGIGIPAENLTKIFNHGFTTRKGGHGFGLHSGANAAKELGGSLVAHSEGLGKGASFTLVLPLRFLENRKAVKDER